MRSSSRSISGASALQKEYPGCDTYSDSRELLSRRDIDLVINATPSNKHFAIAKELLSAGFNVLTEKPFVPTVAECDELTAIAESKGVHMLVFQQSRFANYFLKVKEIIASGKLGRIAHISIQFNGFARRWDWQCCLENNGGNLANTGPHPLDQALNLMDNYDEMPNVFCHMDRLNTFGKRRGLLQADTYGQGPSAGRSGDLVGRRVPALYV